MGGTEIIKRVIDEGRMLETPKVYFVVNVDGKTLQIDYKNPEHSILTEYLSNDEYNDMVTALKLNRFHLQVFYNEDEFIKYAMDNLTEIRKTNSVVFNLARNGKGINKKALVPAFCNLHDIITTGSGVYHVCLGRHKYHTNSILKSNGVSVAESWLYTQHGWLLGKKPPQGLQVIAKPVFESASRGITYNSILTITEGVEKELLDICLRFEQDVIVQEFISGYEVSVPIIIHDKIYPLMAVGISMMKENKMGNRIITFDDAFNETYSFYNFNDTDAELATQIQQMASKAAECMGLEQYCRMDFRISTDNTFYITDTSTHPFLIKHSAFAFAFQELGFSFADIFAFLIRQRQLEMCFLQVK